MAKKPWPLKCTKSAISQFATLNQLHSLKKFHRFNFSIFLLEILNIASQLNSVANYWLRFFNFDFSAIFRPYLSVGPKKGQGPTDTHIGLGPLNPTKNLSHLVELLGHLLSRHYFSNFFDLGPPFQFCVDVLLITL